MLRKSCFALGLVGLCVWTAAAQESKPAPAATRTLKIKLSYTGTGKVDASHKIFVFLFDSPDFVKGDAMPIATGSATAKDETVTFNEIGTSPVYFVAAYDPSGGYDGTSGPPPSGSSIGLRSSNPGQPDAVKIEPGKTVLIELAFDDAVKMP
jgi:hypothetical protein